MKAFPWHEGFENEAGMDLRDYFAAFAMQGLLVEFTNKREMHDFEISANLCYMVADAMMKAREK